MLHSGDDPFIPLAEAEHAAASLRVPLTVAAGRSHFFEPCEEIVTAVYGVLDEAERRAAEGKAGSPSSDGQQPAPGSDARW